MIWVDGKKHTSRQPALPMALRLPVGVVGVLAALAVVALAVGYAGDTASGQLDQWLRSAVQDALPGPGTGALLVDFVAEPVGAVISVPLLGAVCLVLRRPRLAMLAVAGPTITVLVVTGLKPMVGRTINGGHLAYPSGHTAFATALAIVLALLVVSLLQTGKLGGTVLVLAAAGVAGAAMAWSQVALGAHYATDTLGGFCCGLVVVPATGWLIDTFVDR